MSIRTPIKVLGANIVVLSAYVNIGIRLYSSGLSDHPQRLIAVFTV